MGIFKGVHCHHLGVPIASKIGAEHLVVPLRDDSIALIDDNASDSEVAFGDGLKRQNTREPHVHIIRTVPTRSISG
jgi:hypothetical protein